MFGVHQAEELDRVGITHIICVRQDIEAHWIRPNFVGKYHYITLDIADMPTQNIIQHFPKVKLALMSHTSTSNIYVNSCLMY